MWYLEGGGGIILDKLNFEHPSPLKNSWLEVFESGREDGFVFAFIVRFLKSERADRGRENRWKIWIFLLREMRSWKKERESLSGGKCERHEDGNEKVKLLSTKNHL